MLTEAFFLLINLTLFSHLLSELFTTSSSFKNQRQNIFFFFLLNLLFLSTFFLHGYLDFSYFDLKEFFFQISTGFLAIFLSIFIFVSKNLKFSTLGFSLGLFFGPFSFFLLFGVESFGFGGSTYEGLQLVKSQNPILAFLFSGILFFRDKNIRWFLVLLLITSLASYSKHRISLLERQAPQHIYSRYSPPEFFLSGDFLLVEEENGVYSYVRETEVDEPIYRFTMKPLRYLKRSERQYTQNLVSKLSFPVVILENKEVIYIAELFRTYKGIPMQIRVRKGKSGLELEGPLF